MAQASASAPPAGAASPAPSDETAAAAAIVEQFLVASMIPDPEAAARHIADDLIALPLLVLPVTPASAGPQDDPPPVAIAAGDDSLVPNYTYSLTLTLDGSAGNGDLEQGQVEQARAAAAAAQGHGPVQTRRFSASGPTPTWPVLVPRPVRQRR